MAGMEGVEPSHTVPETAVLPLDDIPVANVRNKKPDGFLVQTRVNILLTPTVFVKTVF